MKTRDKIKTIASEQFNTYGATNTSTIRLSNYLKISPGNFYYYFKSKEHLIRNLWEEDIIPSFNDILLSKKYKTEAAGLVSFMEACVRHAYAFRFFYRELFILQKNDPELKAAYARRISQMLPHVESTLSVWEDEELIKMPECPEARIHVMENLWVVLVGWAGFSESYSSRVSEKQLQKKMLINLFSAFSMIFTEKGTEEVLAILQRKKIITSHE